MTRNERMLQMFKEMGRLVNLSSKEIRDLSNELIFDDHDVTAVPNKYDAFVVLNGQVCVYFENTNFTLNPLMREKMDGVASIEVGSIGGCVRYNDNLKTPIDRIKDYNESCISDSYKIKEYHCGNTIIFF